MAENDVKAAVQKGNQRFMQSISRGDASAVAGLYAEGARLLPPNSDFIEGHEAIRQFWQGALDMGIRGAKLETLEVEAAGDRAVEIGRYTLEVKGGETADTGKYLVVWKKEGESWKLYRDIWNTSRPAQ